MDIIANFPLLVDWKNNNDDLILVIIDCLINIIYYKSIKTIINIASLAKIIINIVIKL